MSRHRNFRNYSYEDDMSEDVYGHSVEDYDIAVSPTTAAQFMYRRTNSRDASELGHYMGSVMEEEEDSEEDDHLQNSEDYKRPQLDPVSEAKLSSCLDQLHSILGETCHEPTAVEAVLRHKFDVEKALDDILNGGSKKEPRSAATKPSSSKGVKKSNTKTCYQFSVNKQNQSLKSLVKEQERCNINQLFISEKESSAAFSNTTPMEGNMLSSAMPNLISVKDPAIKTSEALASVLLGSNSSTELLVSQSKLLSTPLSGLSQSSDPVSADQSGHLWTRKGFSSSCLADESGLRLASLSSLSELSAGSVQLPSPITSAANRQDFKETSLLSTPLSLSSQNSNRSNADQFGPLSPLSGLSVAQISDQQTTLSRTQDPLSQLAAGSPPCTSSVGSAASSIGVKESKLFSTSLNSLMHTSKDVSMTPEKQSPRSKSEMLSSSPLGAVSLADLAKSHAGTAVSDLAFSGTVQNQMDKLKSFGDIQSAGSPSLATLTQEYKVNSEGKLSLGVILPRATGGVTVSAGKRDFQGPKVKAVTLADLAQKHTHSKGAPDPFADRTDMAQLNPLPSHGSLFDLNKTKTNVLQRSSSVQTSEPIASLNGSKKVKMSTSGSTLLSLADLARSNDECCSASATHQSPSNLSDHGKQSSNFLNSSAKSMTQTRIETGETSFCVSGKDKPDMDEGLPRNSLLNLAVEFHGEIPKSEKHATDHNRNKVSSGSSPTAEAIPKSKNEISGITLLSACLGSLSVSEQQNISGSIGSNTVKTCQDTQLSSRKQSSNRKPGTSDSLVAKPSMFALTISYTYKLPKSEKMELLMQHAIPAIDYGGNITSFDFSNPSPDDLVFEKQKKAFTRK